MKEIKRGQFQIEVGGKQINLQFGMRFWKNFDREGYKIEKLDTYFNQDGGIMGMIDVLVDVLSISGETYAAKNGSVFGYDKDDIYEWFEEDIDDKVMGKIVEAMLSTKIFGNSVNQGLDRSGKQQPKVKK